MDNDSSNASAISKYLAKIAKKGGKAAWANKSPEEIAEEMSKRRRRGIQRKKR